MLRKTDADSASASHKIIIIIIIPKPSFDSFLFIFCPGMKHNSDRDGFYSVNYTSSASRHKSVFDEVSSHRSVFHTVFSHSFTNAKDTAT